ncbi:MAG: T9SS type A sorting domain-containing protein [Bacteroidota bacterium]
MFNNEIYLCGSLKVSTILGSGEFKLAFAKYQNSNGSLVVSKNYCNAFLGNQFNSMHIKNNSVFLTGAVSTQTNLYNGYRHAGIFFKIKHNGDSTSMKLYNHFTGNSDNLEMFFDIKECNDGGFIMGGAPVYVTAPQSQNWVVKTDSNGVGPGMVTVSIKEFTNTNFKLTIYPVPAKDVLNIELLTNNNAVGSIEATESKNTIEIINIFGQVINSVQLSAANNIINVNGLKAGVYFLHATINNEVLKQKIIIEK